MACGKGHKEIALVLLRNGTDSNDGRGKQGTPLDIACANGRMEIVKELLKVDPKYDLDIPLKMMALVISMKPNEEITLQLLEGENYPLQKTGDWLAVWMFSVRPRLQQISLKLSALVTDAA